MLHRVKNTEAEMSDVLLYWNLKQLERKIPPKQQAISIVYT